MNIILRSIYILSLSLALFIVGCGEDKIPDPPLIRSQTVIDTYNVLEKNEHSVALKKIVRLRKIDPSNVFLANLEVLERNNSVIDEAQLKIDDGDLVSALAIVSAGIRKHGKHKDLIRAQKKLKVVTKIHEILDVFKEPRDSEQLSAAATQLKKIGETYKPASIFISLCDRKLVEAKLMDKWEMNRAVSSLCSHINDLHVGNDSDVELLYAVLEIEDPTNPMLINYLEYLNGAEVDLIIYPEENIFADTEGDTPDEKKEEKKDKEKEKNGSWWNKFSF